MNEHNTDEIQSPANNGEPETKGLDTNEIHIDDNHNQRNKQCPICRESYNYLINIFFIDFNFS